VTPYQYLLLASVTSSLMAMLAFVRVLRVERRILELHLELNSRLDQLIELTRLNAHAAGMAEERANEHARNIGEEQAP
jgi:hypothetical protein